MRKIKLPNLSDNSCLPDKLEKPVILTTLLRFKEFLYCKPSSLIFIYLNPTIMPQKPDNPLNFWQELNAGK